MDNSGVTRYDTVGYLPVSEDFEHCRSNHGRFGGTAAVALVYDHRYQDGDGDGDGDDDGDDVTGATVAGTMAMWRLWQAKLHNISSTTTTTMEKVCLCVFLSFSALSVCFFYCSVFVFRLSLRVIDSFACD